MRIGNFETSGNIFLAPMAGVTDLPFRVICKEYGCALLYTEMINAKAVCYEDKNTFEMLQTVEAEGDVVVQIFGSEPNFMGESASIIGDLGRFRAIDINMGCPVPKVVKNGEGSALMKDLKLASKIIEEVKRRSPIPVTVKFRTGWDSNSINAVEFAKMAEESGADAVAVHGRTREQYYSGKADWEIIAKVKERLKIPVIANGDIFTVQNAIDIVECTKADGIMIGRGAQGNPFIFKEFEEYQKTGQIPITSDSERIDTMLEHYRCSIRYKGEERSVREMRKHIGWYLKGMKGSAKMRNEINQLNDLDEVLAHIEEYKRSLSKEGPTVVL
ncbi:MAG: tRNA dihydrouridine synthase DusB [Peptostreptococcaceae bacterium]|nr:tRNA dihydrouridine synthase DusB [Peptostreptococcaceae bacterium]